jgi:hypothetical protein
MSADLSHIGHMLMRHDAVPQPAALPDRIRLPLTLDHAAVTAALAVVNGSLWTAHYVPDNYAGDWAVLPLRYPAGETHPIRQAYADPTATTFDESPLLAAMPGIVALLAAIPAVIESVRLMRLTPGSLIHAHRDDDLDADLGRARLHVALATNAGVEFRVNDVPVTLAVGELWYLRLSDVHAVANHGASDRIHLVIDCRVGDELKAMLATAARISA